MKTNIIAILLSFSLFCLMAAKPAAAFVIRKGDKAFIEDQDGERWDVTQAKSTVNAGMLPRPNRSGSSLNGFSTALAETRSRLLMIRV